MPGKKTFLSNQDRRQHEKLFRNKKTNWQFPFEPWVIETWDRYSKENKLSEIANKVKDGMKETFEKLKNQKKNKNASD